MTKPLEGKTAFVTGGNRGTGAAIVRCLVRDGARVGITTSDPPDEAQFAEWKRDGLMAFEADPFDGEGVGEALAHAVTRMGAIDILVNNAGIGAYKPIGETTLDDFDRMVNINLRAVFAATTEAVKTMPDGGRIILIGSIAADYTPGTGAGLYAMTKAGLAAMGRGWARDLGGRAITVNTLQPGPLDTDSNPADGPAARRIIPRIPLLRYGRPEEVGELVCFLASDRGANITGATIDIDGGISL